VDYRLQALVDDYRLKNRLVITHCRLYIGYTVYRVQFGDYRLQTTLIHWRSQGKDYRLHFGDYRLQTTLV
jgi:mRNA-degrading endonuclease RelE of RelBE toxin-antitoxin system